MANKILSMLLGLHCGDSLGATLEFSPPRRRDHFHEEITGGGFFSWTAGQATDDTDLMIALLKSITEKKKLDFDLYVKNILSWFASNPRDIGNTTRAALKRLSTGTSYKESGETHEQSLGNGSLMRCAPLALIPFNRQIIKQQCSITHAHKTCIDADLIFIKSLQEALTGKDKFEIFQSALYYSKQLNPTIYAAIKNIPDIEWDSLKTSGFVVDTLASSYWGLLHTNTLKSAIVEIVNRGDDADTCGAVMGAFAGAYYGISEIPEQWLKAIEKKNVIEDLIMNLCW